MARGATPIARAIAFCEIPIGSRYSSSKISPGIMGGLMIVTYDVIGSLSMVVRDTDLGRSQICPAKNNAPLLINPNRVKTGKISF